MIKGEEKYIRDIFCDNFVFEIPRYQRPYAWTTEEAGILLDDILAFISDDVANIGNLTEEDLENLSEYFLGSVVLIKDENDPKSQVVDGQQRLTTLTILLSVIRELVANTLADNEREVVNRLVFELNSFICEQSGIIMHHKDRPRLQLRKKDRDYFKTHIQDEHGIKKLNDTDPHNLTDSEKNIQQNAMLFYNKLQNFSLKQFIALSGFIINNCCMIIVWTSDTDSAYRTFSILNDRGMNLSFTDILKSEIIGKVSKEKEEKYTKEWEYAEDSVGREDFKNLFTHIRTIYRKEKAKKKTVLEEIRKFVKPSQNPEEFIDNVLLPYRDAYDVIKNAAHQNENYAINESLKWLNKIDNFDWMPPAMLFLHENQNDPVQLGKFFSDLERLASGLMIQRANLNERIKRYGALLTDIETNKYLYKDDSALQLSETEKQNILEILNGDLYLISKIRLYVLLKLDREVAGEGAIYDHSVISVEHVLPQNPQQDSVWVKWFPDEDERQKYTHKIGNLVLLARKKNSQAGNYDFDEKKEKYFSTRKGVTPFAITTKVLQEDEWTPDVIACRQKDSIDALKKIWRL